MKDNSFPHLCIGFCMGVGLGFMLGVCVCLGLTELVSNAFTFILNAF